MFFLHLLETKNLQESENHPRLSNRLYKVEASTRCILLRRLFNEVYNWLVPWANPAELQQYLELQSGEQPITCLQVAQPSEQVRDFRFYSPSETVSNDECVLLDEATSSSVGSSLSVCSATFTSAAFANVDNDKYLQGKCLSQIHKFLNTLCPSSRGQKGLGSRLSLPGKWLSWCDFQVNRARQPARGVPSSFIRETGKKGMYAFAVVSLLYWCRVQF